ncbi:hypothetical protein ACH5RR_020124 [Cinchona calisaya]|uniref:BSD domain-containing protein n=1 Tax=Cinchona calisaya TaxID=153742 RepID=A0ABD2ZDK5_9GENT
MNFFKSILSDDPDPPYPEKSQDSEPDSPSNQSQGSDDQNDVVTNANPVPHSSADGGTSSTTTTSLGGWSFGGLVKTLATRSESVLETYRRDLQEFGSGLRKETEIFREVASRAVKDLPASIEVGASVAHGSLESVTHAIDGVIKSTAEIISHGKEPVISSSDVESETPDTSRVSGSGRYRRFDAQLNAIQNDLNTFCEEPEDLEDYNKWKLWFSLEEKSEEFENLIGENGVLEGVYGRVVPNVVDNETFWCRYFYRVHKLKQQESVRANLVKRAISTDDEEELSWDVDDDDENQLEKNVKSKVDDSEKKALDEQNSSVNVKQESSRHEHENESSEAVNKDGVDKPNVDDNNGNVVELREVSVPDEKAKVEESSSQVKQEDKLVKEDEKADLDGKRDQGEACKDIDVAVVVSSQQSVPEEEEEEEDMGWDEIEDIGSGDEKKGNTDTQGRSPNTADVRKRLSAADEDEDLSWDIEEDD